MRVLVWATHLQTDILALVHHLDGLEDVELVVVTPQVDAFLREPIARARPLGCALLERGSPGVADAIRKLEPHVVVADNHLPDEAVAPRLLYMWHGLGWKARGAADLETLYRAVRRLTGGDPRGPNPRFMAQCYGEPDRAWRVERWGLDPGSCPILGMAFSDLVESPPYDRQSLADRYEMDVVNRKTVLMSITWHHGGIFVSSDSTVSRLMRGAARRREDLALLSRVVDALGSEDANLLLCLHERRRYEPAYLEALHELASSTDRMQIKHKDEHPDNLADLLVADVMVSNLSSFITYFYLLGRPTVHLLSPEPDPGRARLARLRMGKVAYRKLGRDEDLWMNDPLDNGGLAATSGPEAVEAIVRGLREPECCVERARSWLDRHVSPVDGLACERLEEALRGLCTESA